MMQTRKMMRFFELCLPTYAYKNLGGGNFRVERRSEQHADLLGYNSNTSIILIKRNEDISLRIKAIYLPFLPLGIFLLLESSTSLSW